MDTSEDKEKVFKLMRLIEKVYGEKISYEEAKQTHYRLRNFYRLLAKPLPPEE